MNYDDLLPDVLANCPGVDPGFAIRTLKRVGMEFCIKTLLWEEDIDITTVASQQDFTISPPQEAVAMEIVGVKVKTVSTQVFEDMPYISDGRYSLVDDNTLHFVHSSYAPVYAITNGLRVRVVLRPTMNSAELPEHYFDRWGEALIGGATHKLMMAPEKPYTNPNAAGFYLNHYNTGVIRAGVEKLKLGRPTLEGFSG